MKVFKILLLAVITFNLAGCASAQTNRRKPAQKPEAKSTKPMSNKPTAETASGETKIIAEGFYGTVETPFIFAARSAETYEQLRKLIENLLPASEIDFTKTAVVAAFAGTKNTGGYSVAIRRTVDKISIELVEPPKDAITTDALTQPFAVALVPIDEENTLPLEASVNWKNAMQNYKITSGEFESSGGFAGRLKKFNASGTIGVLSFGDYITLVFNLSGKGADANLRLNETGSGVMKNGRIDLLKLNAGSLAEGPKPPLKVSGTVTGDVISLTLEPLPTRVADGFQVGGKIKAVKIK